jgi:D-alanyl-D-alanine carboxypeptidase (penicillin-binding protein 5/6)
MKRALSLLFLIAILAISCTAGGEFEAPAENEDVNTAVTIENLPAKSALLADLSTGRVLYELNPDIQLPPASITKIMTMLLVIEAAEAGNISYDDVVTASEHASSMGGSQIYLEPGEQLTVLELYKAVSIASANDAAVALAEHVGGSESVFVSMMNERAKELGMTNTVFKNACGLDEDGHLTTARDIAIMSVELAKHEMAFRFSTVWMDSVRNGEFGLTNTNKLIKTYKGITGLKTGSTDKAKFCMSATAERNGISLCAVVMGCDTGQIRFSSSAALLDYGFAAFEKYDITGGLTPPGITVKYGETESLTPVFEPSPPVLIPKNSSSKVEREINCESAVSAPVAKGQVLGFVTAKLNGELLGRVNMVAPDAVGRLTFFKALFRLISSFSLF